MTESKKARAVERSQRPGTAVAPPPQKKGGVPLLVIGAAVFLIFGGAAAVAAKLAFTTPKPAGVEMPALDLTQQGEDVTPPTSTETFAKPIPLHIVSDPLGARVEIAGKDVGTTPFDYALSRPVAAVFSKDGFEPAQATVSPSDAPQLSVQLKKKRGSGKRPQIKTER
jgi:hypothetical protein